MTDATTVVLTSTDTGKAWAANYWDQTASGRKGVIKLLKAVSTAYGFDVGFTANVTTNGALTPGGTSTVTMDAAAPGTFYDRYTIHGAAGPAAMVWRKYLVLDPVVARSMVGGPFSRPFPDMDTDTASVNLIRYPQAKVFWSPSGNRPYFNATAGLSWDSDSGHVILEKPSVIYFGTRSNLEVGGASTDGIPADIRVVVAVAAGDLEVACPADSGSPSGPTYQGTLYTVDGIQRTLTITAPWWRDPRNTSQVQAFACDWLDAVKDTVVNLHLPLAGYWADGVAPGYAVDVTGPTYTTPLTGLALPAVECDLEFHEGQAPYVRTIVRASNRRSAFSASFYLRPDPTGLVLGTPTGEPISPGLPDIQGFSVPGWADPGAGPWTF
jgi:hypothetical protein